MSQRFEVEVRPCGTTQSTAETDNRRGKSSEVVVACWRVSRIASHRIVLHCDCSCDCGGVRSAEKEVGGGRDRATWRTHGDHGIGRIDPDAGEKSEGRRKKNSHSSGLN